MKKMRLDDVGKAPDDSKKEKYTLFNDADGNISIELGVFDSAENAMAEALDKLGWSLMSEDHIEDENECVSDEEN